MPRDTSMDSSLALLKEGYNFVGNRCKRLDTDIFATRLLMQETVCMQGEEAARLFYTGKHLTRKGAIPRAAQKTLTGKGAVMIADGAQHRSRKQMLMSMMTPERIGVLGELVAEEWGQRIPAWETKDKVLLFDEMQQILFCAACRWCGVALEESEIVWRTFEFGMLIDGAGGVGPRHWQARSARQSAERWLAQMVAQTRAGELAPPQESGLHKVSFHREPEAGLLGPRQASVVLINVIRPIVAIARFITFAATALHQYPENKSRIADREEGFLDCFVHEVRRMYSFFPIVAARVGEDFEWKGYHFSKGTRVILDLYGTCHDRRIWNQPEQFNPNRFREWDGGRFNFVPQGGGDHYSDHRCAGEWVTIELMRIAVLTLAKHLEYEVPQQDLKVDLRRMPMLTNSRFVMQRVRLRR